MLADTEDAQKRAEDARKAAEALASSARAAVVEAQAAEKRASATAEERADGEASLRQELQRLAISRFKDASAICKSALAVYFLGITRALPAGDNARISAE